MKNTLEEKLSQRKVGAGSLLGAIMVQLVKEAEILKKFYKTKDVHLDKFKLCILRFHLNLESFFNLRIGIRFLGETFSQEHDVFEEVVLSKISWFAKARILMELKILPKYLFEKAKNINTLRNSLVHIKRKETVYKNDKNRKVSVRKDKTILIQVMKDYIAIADSLTGQVLGKKAKISLGIE